MPFAASRESQTPMFGVCAPWLGDARRRVAPGRSLDDRQRSGHCLFPSLRRRRTANPDSNGAPAPVCVLRYPVPRELLVRLSFAHGLAKALPLTPLADTDNPGALRARRGAQVPTGIGRTGGPDLPHVMPTVQIVYSAYRPTYPYGWGYGIG